MYIHKPRFFILDKFPRLAVIDCLKIKAYLNSDRKTGYCSDCYNLKGRSFALAYGRFHVFVDGNFRPWRCLRCLRKITKAVKIIRYKDCLNTYVTLFKTLNNFDIDIDISTIVGITYDRRTGKWFLLPQATYNSRRSTQKPTPISKLTKMSKIPSCRHDACRWARTFPNLSHANCHKVSKAYWIPYSFVRLCSSCHRANNKL